MQQHACIMKQPKVETVDLSCGALVGRTPTSVQPKDLSDEMFDTSIQTLLAQPKYEGSGTSVVQMPVPQNPSHVSDRPCFVQTAVCPKVETRDMHAVKRPTCISQQNALQLGLESSGMPDVQTPAPLQPKVEFGGGPVVHTPVPVQLKLESSGMPAVQTPVPVLPEVEFCRMSVVQTPALVHPKVESSGMCAVQTPLRVQPKVDSAGMPAVQMPLIVQPKVESSGMHAVQTLLPREPKVEPFGMCAVLTPMAVQPKIDSSGMCAVQMPLPLQPKIDSSGMCAVQMPLLIPPKAKSSEMRAVQTTPSVVAQPTVEHNSIAGVQIRTMGKSMNESVGIVEMPNMLQPKNQVGGVLFVNTPIVIQTVDKTGGTRLQELNNKTQQKYSEASSRYGQGKGPSSSDMESTVPSEPKEIHSEPYRCSLCSANFNAASYLLKHLTVAHPQGSGKENCIEKYPRLSQQSFHANDMTSKGSFSHPFQCKVCEAILASFPQLKMHLMKHAGIRPHKCDTCGKRFTCKDILRRHIRHHANIGKEKSHKCTVCGVAYHMKFNLQKHMKTHTGADRSFCPWCHGSFVRLELHIFAKHKDKIDTPGHVCHTCGKAFLLRSQLNSHMMVHKMPNAKKFVCDVCGDRLATRIGLRNHLYTKHVGKCSSDMVVCEVCGRTFPTRSLLHKHVYAVHKAAKPHKCEICNYAFKAKASLINHLQIHTGDKPHKCKVCGVGFASAINIIQHMRTHTGEKPFKCTVCDVAFARKDNIKQHMRIHTGEKPYTCPVCKAKFARSDNFRRHVMRHGDQHLESL